MTFSELELGNNLIIIIIIIRRLIRRRNMSIKSLQGRQVTTRAPSHYKGAEVTTRAPNLAINGA